jgi:hypothetical protein
MLKVGTTSPMVAAIGRFPMVKLLTINKALPGDGWTFISLPNKVFLYSIKA